MKMGQLLDGCEVVKNGDEECQKDPPETFLDDKSPYKTYTYVSFRYQQMTSTALFR